MIVRALGACRPECPWCAQDFWRWLKARMHSLDHGSTSFAAHAATSVVRPREYPAPGERSSREEV